MNPRIVIIPTQNLACGGGGRGTASQGNSNTVEPGWYGHQRDTQKCPHYPGIRIKRTLRINITDTCFIHTKTKAYNLKAAERYLTYVQTE